MSQPLRPAYRLGTHRLFPPEETLARIAPHLSRFGITRCADATGLDADLGVPVYMAIRPRGAVFQSSAGKGLTRAAAKVSALMEAIELDVAERPDPSRLRRASRAELVAEGRRADALPEWASAAGRFLGDRYRIDWALGCDLRDGSPVWVPAGAAYFHEPSPCRTTTNGLSSGNHIVEATLHGLYEVIERDALARLAVGDRLSIDRSCDVVDPATVTDPALSDVLARIARADTKAVLLRVRCGVGAPVFWALLLDRRPFAGTSALNAGAGAHLDATVALSRAITEAVQSRITMIHGARDDIVEKPVYAAQMAGAEAAAAGPAFRYFDALVPSPAPADRPYEGDLEEALSDVMGLLKRAGQDRIYRVDMGCPLPGTSVVKIIAPGLYYRRELF